LCEMEVGIEGCGRFCSELHDLPFTIYYEHNHSKEDNTYVECSMHLVQKKVIQSCLRNPEQEEPLGIQGRIM